MKPENDSEIELRHVRLERKAKTQISSDDGQGWAVSYSDMLMVLMSFFVIYFSFDDKQKESLVSKIAIEMRAKAGNSTKDLPSVAGSFSETEPQTAKHATPKISDIVEKLRAESISSEVSVDSDQLTIHLSDQVYASRQFAINKAIQMELGIILDTLSPFKEHVRITFIGHTDDSILQSQSKYLSNNLDLSSLRASRAISFAVGRGFDPRNLAIEAVASNVRNTRSLSIKVVPTSDN